MVSSSLVQWAKNRFFYVILSLLNVLIIDKLICSSRIVHFIVGISLYSLQIQLHKKLGQSQHNGSVLDCRSTGRGIDPMPGAWIIPKFISLAQIAPIPCSAELKLKTSFIHSFISLLHKKQLTAYHVELLIWEQFHNYDTVRVCREIYQAIIMSFNPMEPLSCSMCI